MPILSILVAPPIRWIISNDDPDELTFPSGSPLGGLSLINPMARHGDELEGFPQGTQVDTNRRFHASTRLDFRMDGTNPASAEDVGDHFLRWARFVSGQATAFRMLAHQFVPDRTNDEWRSSNTPPVKGRLLPWVEATALTFAMMRRELEQTTSLAVPTYADVLLDAIDAAQNGDYRKAILYTAIAVEVMASTVLDGEAPEGAIAGAERNDPVRVHLRRSARREFRVLLHELPLYLKKRSLLVENDVLYQRLIRLHGTRNDLAHTGDVSSTVERFSIDYDGTKLAVRTAISAFRWFNARGRYFPIFGASDQ